MFKVKSFYHTFLHQVLLLEVAKCLDLSSFPDNQYG